MHASIRTADIFTENTVKFELRCSTNGVLMPLKEADGIATRDQTAPLQGLQCKVLVFIFFSY